MNFLKSCAAIVLAILFSGATVQGQTATDPNEGAVLTQTYLGYSGYYTFSWWGRAGRTYFLQQSEDLINWTYLPIIETGYNQVTSWGFTSDGDRFFVRLKLTDIVTSNPYTDDFDGDGVSNYDELQHGTDPLDPNSLDTDGDGMPDAYEIANGLNKNVDDSLDDADGDGYPNVFEYKRGTKVNVAGLDPDPANPVAKPPPIYTVDPNGTGTHTSVQEAIDAAAYGYYDYQTGKYVKGADYSIIIVKSGIYNEYIYTEGKRVLLIAQPGQTEPVTVVGGAYIYDSCKIDGFVFAQLGNYGSGVYVNCYDGTVPVRLDNCIIRDNYSYYGGGVQNQGGSLTLVNCTLLNNQVNGAGKAIYNGYGCSTRIVKSILWDTDSGALDEIKSEDNNYVTVQNSIVRGGEFGGANTDPLLTPVGYLRTGSPAINAGVAGLTLNRDIHSTARPVGPSVDIGAEEFKDTDGDGVPDWWETAHGLNPNNSSDVNAISPRSSGFSSSYTYLQEYTTVKDSNLDGIPDWWDTQYFVGIRYAGFDYDSDGLTNLQEFQLGLNPNNADTDGDAIPDGWEVSHNLNPKVNDASLNPDNDGLTNLWEYRLDYDPFNPDTGNTGVLDGQKDKDYDGLTNVQEINTYHTDPTQYDTDGDGYNDGWEIRYGFDPLFDDNNNPDPNKRPDADCDGDGLTNLEEEQIGTNPFNTDTDGDGFSDKAENDAGSDPDNSNSTPNNPGGGPGGGTNPPAPTIAVSVTVGDHSGSHSEKYRVVLTPLEGDPNTKPRYRTNQKYGDVQTYSFNLPKGAKYNVTLVHVGTDPKYSGPPKPDYDYTLNLGGGGSNDTLIFHEDPQGMLGVHDESTPFFASGKSATLYIAWLTSETAKSVPSNRKRLKLGVGEIVNLTVKPTVPSVSWQLTGTPDMTSISSQSGQTTTMTAGEKGCAPGVQATIMGGSLSLAFNVIVPSTVYLNKTSDSNSNPPLGVSMQAEWYIGPEDVNFSAVAIAEGQCPANCTGYFTYQQGNPHGPGQDLPVTDTLVAGRGWLCGGIDGISGGSRGPTYSPGKYTWSIPWSYKINGNSYNFTTVDHVKEMTIGTNGKATLSLTKRQASTSITEP